MKLSNEKIDKLIKSYFNIKFKNANLVKINIGEYKGWYGFVIGDETKRGDYRMILGTDEPDLLKYRRDWFYDGNYFGGGKDILGLDFDEFRQDIKRYINNLYPDLEIVNLS